MSVLRFDRQAYREQRLPYAWQGRCLDVLLNLFATGSHALVEGCPGAGKTRLGGQFARRLIDQNLITHIHIVVPSIALVESWTQTLRNHCGIEVLNRENRSLEYCEFDFGGIQGIVTTYQRVARAAHIHARVVNNTVTLVILDECHHPGQNKSWGVAVTSAFRSARFVLSLSGTPFRHDRQRIPFIPYEKTNEAKNVAAPDFRYGYQEAINDRVCRPVVFKPYQTWLTYSLKGKKLDGYFSDDGAADTHENKFLAYSLHPDAGLVEEMVRDADANLKGLRARGGSYGDAAGLLVAMNQQHAEHCADIVRRVTGAQPYLVISNDANAADSIESFKRGTARWVVAVRMISEGVDIPRLMAVVYATNYTTQLFIIQLVGRVIRTRDPDAEELGWVYMPADPRLKAAALALETPVAAALKSFSESGQYEGAQQQVEDAMRILRAPENFEVIECEVEAQSLIYREEEIEQERIQRAEIFRQKIRPGSRFEFLMHAPAIDVVAYLEDFEAASAAE